MTEPLKLKIGSKSKDELGIFIRKMTTDYNVIRHPWTYGAYVLLTDDGSQVKGTIRIATDYGRIWIEEISVPEDQRGKGYAKEILSLLTTIADKQNVELGLQAKRIGRGGLTSPQLRKLYKQFGFKSEKGNLENMIRLPK